MRAATLRGYQGRQASVDFLVAQRPNHDRISTSRESLSELEKAVEAEDWPSEHRKQSLDAIEQAEGKCR